jgi:hypothetical protein
VVLNLFPGLDSWPANQRNVARYLFLHPAAQDLHSNWDQQFRSCVAGLRALAGTDPDAPDLAHLMGELLLKARTSHAYGSATTSKGTPTAQRPSTTPKSVRSPSASKL